MVTGAKGQLGNEIRVLSADYKESDFLFSDIDELDIRDYEKLRHYVSDNIPTIIINCAAYTAVDKAESEHELATEINVMAAGNLAKVSKEYGLKLIHLSTDYVFDGNNNKPYLETDKTNPCSVYGKTKLEGEKEIVKVFGALYSVPSAQCLFIRTSWLYSSFGNNFVKSIIKYARERGKLNVVYDQVGSPTYARDLAKAILSIVHSPQKNNQLPAASSQLPVEIYNYSNEGVCSWYDFAKAILEITGISCELDAIETKDYPTPAKRPSYSVFNKDKIKNTFGLKIPYWRDSLKECLSIMLNAEC